MTLTDGALALAPKTREQLLEQIKVQYNLDTILFLDFETFYKTKSSKDDKSFSLSSREYYDYITNERFEITGLGFADNLDEWEYIHTPIDIEEFIAEYQNRRTSGERIGLIAHNTVFDGSIMSWLYNLTFDFYFCTQCMAVQDNPTMSKSLENTAVRLWPTDDSMRKGTELVSFDGKPYHKFTDYDHAQMQKYCIQDNHLMREMFLEFLPSLPFGELEMMHITLRGAIEPQFVIKRELLAEVKEIEEGKKSEAVAKAMAYCHDKNILFVTFEKKKNGEMVEAKEVISPKTFSSNPQYEALLKRFNLVIPTKLNPKGQLTSALGKDDPPYIKLQQANPHLKDVFLARMEMKSTNALTRANKMHYVADVFKDYGHTTAEMPMFLNYYGAKNTGRWSGGAKLNQQNLMRGSNHRLALRAQTGHKIAVNDLSNIELRVNLWFCEQADLLQAYNDDINFDMYSNLASDIYGFTVIKSEHKNERQVGKAGSLGLGFAMSWFGFQQYLAGGPLGMEPMFVTDEFAKGVKSAYDIKHYMIKAMWKEIEHYVIPVLELGGNYRFGRNKCVMAMKGAIVLPSGRILRYPNTRSAWQETQWGRRLQYTCDGSNLDRFGTPIRRNIHKGLIIENIIQALARDVLAFQIMNIENALQHKDIGWVIGSVHDEVLAMIQDSFIDKGFDLMQYHMKQVPQWAAGMPLASEGGYADDYSK